MNAIRAWAEAIRGSLFYVPTLFVLGAIALAVATLELDLAIGRGQVELPTLLGATVDSARALLGTVAAATISFAGVAFAISMLMIQLASSQFSPRVLYGFFRDPFSKRVMGIAVGTFTYALLILRSVRAPIDENGRPVIPHVSVFVALVLGIVTILAIIAFINHSAHSMEVGEIIRRITDSTREQIRRVCPDRAGTGPVGMVEGPRPDGEPLVVAAPSDGWIQQIDNRRLLRAVSPGGIIRLDAGMGTFVTAGTPLCTMWHPIDDHDEVARIVRNSIRVGRSRTMQDDIGFGIRQIVDIGLRALSPGINDPTTAYETVVHLGPVVRELLLRDLPPRVIVDDDGRRLFRPQEFDHADYVGLAFDQIRRASTSMLSVGEALLVQLAMLVREVEAEGMTERAGPLRRQAELVLEGIEASGALPADYQSARARAEKLGLISEKAPRAARGARRSPR